MGGVVGVIVVVAVIGLVAWGQLGPMLTRRYPRRQHPESEEGE